MEKTKATKDVRRAHLRIKIHKKLSDAVLVDTEERRF